MASTLCLDDFKLEVESNIKNLGNDRNLQMASQAWMEKSAKHKYTYNFTWLGRPIIQLPQDILAMQEIIWNAQPDFIIETGIAHGGGLIFYASMLELNAFCRWGEETEAKVLGVDIDIRAHNRAAIEAHPMYKRIIMIEGDSVSPKIVAQVHKQAVGKKRILVCLDSNHTHEHVLAELEAYAPLVTSGSYCVVFDTAVEDMPDNNMFSDRPWGKGNNPKTAVHEYLKTHPEFVIDKSIEHKLWRVLFK
jgi:cephalosporin hydroxylase